jgi:FAD/FMN-containing dehydrogenase
MPRTVSDFDTSYAALAPRQPRAQRDGGAHQEEDCMPTMKPVSALELCEAVRAGRPLDPARLNRILRLEPTQGLLEVQAATPWLAIAAELRPGDARARVRTTMPTVGESIERNAAGPDGTPAVAHVACMALVTPEGELRRVSRERDAELFSLCVGGQGLLGTIYSITLRIVTLARTVERASAPEEMTLQPGRAAHTLELLLPPGALGDFMKDLDARCNDWRTPLQSVAVRRTAAEEDTFLRWARRDYAEVKLGLVKVKGLGAAVRAAQLRRELIDAAIAAGGSFQIACTGDATREQVRTCYPELEEFVAHKRRFDPNERLVNGWYLHQRSLLARELCDVRFAN